MKNVFRLLLLLVCTLSIILISCGKKFKSEKNIGNTSQNKHEFINTMQKHLDAVSNRDLQALQSTMSPEGKMYLILPGSEIIENADNFMEFHREWFKDSSWTFKAKILDTEVGEKYGMAITEIMYQEPEREGKPYFNRMIVSYDLEKVDGKWYIIKDHASSVQKSTDAP